MDTTFPSIGRSNDTRGFIHKRIVGAIGGGLTGGFTGAIGGFLGGGRPKISPIIQPSPFAGPRVPLPGIVPAIERFVPGGNTGFAPQGQTTAAVITHRGGSTNLAVNAGQCAPAGFHKAKSTYTRKIDPCGPYVLANLEVVPAGTFVEGSARRKNPSNGKANQRAINRLKGAETTAVKLLKAVGYKSVTKNARPRR